jgi:hypothetical protein
MVTKEGAIETESGNRQKSDSGSLFLVQKRGNYKFAEMGIPKSLSVGVERCRVDDVGAVGFMFSVSPPKFINRVAQSSPRDRAGQRR